MCVSLSNYIYGRELSLVERHPLTLSIQAFEFSKVISNYVFSVRLANNTSTTEEMTPEAGTRVWEGIIWATTHGAITWSAALVNTSDAICFKELRCKATIRLPFFACRLSSVSGVLTYLCVMAAVIYIYIYITGMDFFTRGAPHLLNFIIIPFKFLGIVCNPLQTHYLLYSIHTPLYWITRDVFLYIFSIVFLLSVLTTSRWSLYLSQTSVLSQQCQFHIQTWKLCHVSPLLVFCHFSPLPVFFHCER